MANYKEYLEALNNLDDVEFEKFIDNFKAFRLETRTQYAVFFAARTKFYDKQACLLLGLETEADRKKAQSEQRYEDEARKILNIPSVKEEEVKIEEDQDILSALTLSGSHAQRAIFKLQKSVTMLRIAFAGIVLFLIVQYLLSL
ncbi:MAG: hypothetical protein ACUZ8E_02385 [Candidatus Anammoxibacter sp.]